MFVCVCFSIFVCVYEFLPHLIEMYVWIYVCLRVSVFVCVCAFLYAFVCMSNSLILFKCTCAFMCVFVWVCACNSVCVHTFRVHPCVPLLPHRTNDLFSIVHRRVYHMLWPLMMTLA